MINFTFITRNYQMKKCLSVYYYVGKRQVQSERLNEYIYIFKLLTGSVCNENTAASRGKCVKNL